MNTVISKYACFSVVLLTVTLIYVKPVLAEPGDIIILREVPPQRFDVNRHTGRASVVNPSPIEQTNVIKELLNDSQLGITELTDMQSAEISSSISLSVGSQPVTGLQSDLIHQLAGSNGRSSVGNEMGGILGMTSGIGGGVGSSVSSATHSATDAIRDVLSGTNFGN